ncbi:WD40/YVTN/BNR-like repeat-containing protein [Natrialba asiatica]|uniref:BNR repeat-containing glycosyl hydrolase n=1 Tax=Natrialba asiatica (strain ATCC 700177 / DSM 12278 / JCM 9576 / FERM P-10747 / NBRC 102637 / 172P1) TaxID=29540 RepID=M0B2L9_NATA1|nr:hypothetical protein [Natrialba asiatica]ELZ03924.1 hypothetical protein C481_05078 [Natrialba asiatica DSM 12278]
MRIAIALRDRLLVCTSDAAAQSSSRLSAASNAATASETGTQRTVAETNANRTTTARLSGHELQCVAASPDAPDRLFVGTFERGLFRSTDGGETFDRLETDDVFASEAVMSLAMSPHDPAVLYAGTEPSRVYRSRDGGDSWTELGGLIDLPSESEWYFPPQPHTHHVRWLEVDPFDPDRLYVGIEAGAFVYSTDGGETWHERPDGSRLDNHSLATHPDREGRLYAAAGDGYAESDDGGEHWAHPQEGLGHRYCWSVVPNPADPDQVLVSSASGASTAHTASRAESYVYRKLGSGDGDGGNEWVRLDDHDLPTGDGVVRTVFATTGDDDTVYGVNNRGLFVTADFGDRWERVDIEWPSEAATQTPQGLAVVKA